jgi:hypothetical protein
LFILFRVAFLDRRFGQWRYLLRFVMFFVARERLDFRVMRALDQAAWLSSCSCHAGLDHRCVATQRLYKRRTMKKGFRYGNRILRVV